MAGKLAFMGKHHRKACENTYFGGVSRFYYTEIDAAKAHRWKTSKSALPGTNDEKRLTGKKEMNRKIP
ncbi:MAG: hypothetical protein Q4A48_07640, partial [Bacillota bacterium]|nr:hypothetical protein [Bacillota bacterium]